ncbi:aldehyde dehydrogenase family protein [bacterium]|nr:aldehyde dehydrogenase family protein [bacterium]
MQNTAVKQSSSPIVSLIQSQRDFFRTGKSKEYAFRVEQLKKLKELVEKHELDFEAALKSDLGRCPAEAYLGETIIISKEIKHTLKCLKGWMKPQKVSTDFPLLPGTSKIHPEPYGVALIIAPWNYPLQLALGPAVASIAAGNCNIIKPSELAPATSALLARLVNNNFPSEFLAVVEGGVPETTELLNEKFDTIFYTGSSQVGRIVMAAAAKHLTPVTLELGGKSPCIVDEEIHLDFALNRIVWGKFLNAGQTCVAPDYLLINEKIKDKFIDALRKKIESFYGKDVKASPDFARIINKRHFDRILKLLDGEKVVIGGKSDVNNLFIEPTIVELKNAETPLMQEEIFGPVLPFTTYKNLDEAINFINDRSKPLALYLFTTNKSVQEKVIKETSAGGMAINDTVVHLAISELPFGGVGDSGMGSYHGKPGFDAFSHFKSILARPFWGENAMRYPPYAKNFGLVRKLYNFLYR